MSERRRGTGCLVAVVALVAVLAAIATIGDRLAKDYVQEEFATGMQGQLGLDAPPQVTIHGWPFLWQVWKREFGHVQMHSDSVLLSDQNRSVRVNDLELNLRQVTASDTYESMVAEDLDATGYLSWEELSRLVPNGEVSSGGPDRIRILYTLEVFGQQIDVEASGRPVLDAPAQKLTIADVNLRVVGMDVPRAITEELMRLRLGEINVALPMELRVDSIAVAERGIDLRVVGSQVPLRR